MEAKGRGKQLRLLPLAPLGKAEVFLDASLGNLGPIPVRDLVTEAGAKAQLGTGPGQLIQGTLHGMGTGVMIQQGGGPVLYGFDAGDQATVIIVLGSEDLVQPPP